MQNARTISLTGDVTGSASFDGSENVSINAKLNIAVLTGTITPKSSDGVLSAQEVNYPQGFTKQNSVVIACEFNNFNSNTTYSTGSTLSIGSYVTGGVPTQIRLRDDKISIEVSNVYAVQGEPAKVYAQKITAPFNYKLVLMKI